MLPPELVQSHFADLKRAFELVVRYEHHDIGKLPGALLDRLKTNGYVVVGLAGWHYWADETLMGLYQNYDLWQRFVIAYITKGNKE